MRGRLDARVFRIAHSVCLHECAICHLLLLYVLRSLTSGGVSDLQFGSVTSSCCQLFPPADSTLMSPHARNEEEVDATGRSVYGEMTLGDHRYDTRGDMGLDPDSDGFQSDGEPTAEDHTTL